MFKELPHNVMTPAAMLDVITNAADVEHADHGLIDVYKVTHENGQQSLLIVVDGDCMSIPL